VLAGEKEISKEDDKKIRRFEDSKIGEGERNVLLSSKIFM